MDNDEKFVRAFSEAYVLPPNRLGHFMIALLSTLVRKEVISADDVRGMLDQFSGTIRGAAEILSEDDFGGRGEIDLT